jgi:hypothetical protein
MQYTTRKHSVIYRVFYKSSDTVTEFYASVIYHWLKISVQLTIVIVLNAYNNVKVSRLEQHMFKMPIIRRRAYWYLLCHEMLPSHVSQLFSDFKGGLIYGL